MKIRIDGLNIRGISSVLPRHIIDMHSLGSVFGERKTHRIIKTTGVEQVHYADEKETASDLCLGAAEFLMSQLEVAPPSIDAVLFASITPDYRVPPTSVILQDRLGLSKNVVAFDINYACSAYIYGLYQAAMLIKAGGCRRVLLCSGDTQSKIANPKDRSLRMLFGDAGTATLIEQGEGTLQFIVKSDGTGYQSLIIPAGGMRIPYSPETCEEHEDAEGNIRSQNDGYMNGMDVMKFSLREVPLVVQEIMESAGWKDEDGVIYAMHQPNRLILEYLVHLIKPADEGRLPIVLTKTGNTGAASIPLLLSVDHERLESRYSLKKVILCGFGVGFSWGAVAADLSMTHIFPPRISEGVSE